MDNMVIILVALYRYRNFSVRIMHPLLENIDGVKPYTIFFKNCETNMFNPPTGKEEKLFAELITKLNPRLVGLSVLSPYVPIAKRLTRLIKDNSSALVIWGGIHPTILPESCINKVDMLCIGEGEGAITDLAIHLRDGQPYQAINNLWIRNGDYVIRNPMRPLIQDLDLLPFPSYGNNSFYFIDSGNIKRKDPLFLDSYFWVQSSRGCPYACSYCVNSLLQPLFRNIGPYTRRRSVSNVIKEIRQNLSVSGNTIDRVFFVDEGFGNTENWLNEFELQYKKEIGLPFCVEYNPQNISSMILDKLVNAGLDTISFGIQTGSDYIRNTIFHRPGNNNEIIALARRINSHDVNIKYDLILDNPYDNERSLENTIEFLLQLPRPFFFHLYSLQYFPNYPLTKRAIEDKYIQQGEANMDALIERTTKNWAFVPKVFPYNRKQILQNIIWLIAGNHVKDSIVRYAVFGGDSLIPKLFLNYLNLKAIILGRILGVGGILWRYPLISYFVKGFKYLLKGDFKDFYHKVRKHILYKINSSGSLHPN